MFDLLFLGGRNMKQILLVVLFLVTTSVNFAQTVRVAAAANLRFVLDDITAVYTTRYPGAKIDVTLGASGTLTQQILNGAQFHIFMAADRIFPEKLKSEGAAARDVRTYAFGKIAIWSNA